MVEYTYDAWGKPLSVTGSLASTLGTANPFRYRSYYFDSETGLYYCNARYYNAEWGRFVNADTPEMLGWSIDLVNANLFSYCYNNPIMFSDSSGMVAFLNTANYYTYAFNNWETNTFLNAIAVYGAVATFTLGIIAAVPTLGISIKIAGVVAAGIAAIRAIGALMNSLGGNRGLSLNITKKWYLLSYVGINKVEPKGFHNIWEVWDAIKESVPKIVKSVGLPNIQSIARKSKTDRISVLAQIILDSYNKKKIVRSNYRIS